MRKLSVVLSVAFLLALTMLPRAGWAQAEVPIFSVQRVHLGAGLNYDWRSAGDAGSLARGYELGVFGAYNLLSPPAGAKGIRLSAVGAALYGVDAKLTNGFSGGYIGLRVTLFDGSRP